MVRAIVQYEAEPDADRYRQHIDEYVANVSCSAFRHGKVFGSPFGEPRFRYYAEFEWDDMDSFKEATNSPEFAASGEDAMAMGIPFTVHFASIE
ncbi:MAG TPA: hypothetical protein VFR38_01920 [Gaiellaceae bacterium]|nr:hypothetical protein [Gaiellaceae bacterium]